MLRKGSSGAWPGCSCCTAPISGKRHRRKMRAREDEQVRREWTREEFLARGEAAADRWRETLDRLALGPESNEPKPDALGSSGPAERG